MEKNTILAVVLCTVILIGFYFMQARRAQPVQMDNGSGQYQPPVTPVADNEADQLFTQQTTPSLSDAEEIPPVTVADATEEVIDFGPQAVEYVTIETDLMIVKLTSAGGDVVSFKLKEHYDKEDNVELILGGTDEAHAFSLAFGGLDAQPETSFFYVNREGLPEYSVEFYRDFAVPAGGVSSFTTSRFRLTKRYEFKPREYMFKLIVTLDGGYSAQGFNFNGNAYTLAFGPQIGPRFEKLDNRYEYRQYITYTNGKRKNAKANDIIDSRPSWASISGKYFTFLAIPYLAQYNLSFSEKAEPGVISTSRLNIIRPSVNTPKVQDTYNFYLGPKTTEALVIYNTGNNEFGLKDANLSEVTASSWQILSPLEKLLKGLLLLFYKIVPNYGVAIILLTLLVKILFFPLTKKGSLATVRMQALAPKIKELQEKYKDNKQKLQIEMANFYKQEGYNPISGCLPMLLQIPIFLAMYNLFNNHFDLRGAMFIPGWIPDLSLPEAIVNFSDGFRLPILGWTALRALPFIYVGSQLIYGKVTQNPAQQSTGQMKMMLYIMPIAFFFILYNMPSGLLIYWIFSNILTLVQQLIINKYFLPKQKEQEAQPVIAPGKKKKR